MRSISTELRIPPSSPMPGRYKSCRRSTGELFTKEHLEGEEELRRLSQSEAAAAAAVVMKVEKQGNEQGKETPQAAAGGKEYNAKDQELTTPGKVAAVSPSKLTPLRWRSNSMKDLNASPEQPVGAAPTSAAAAAAAPAESIQIEPGPTGTAAAAATAETPKEVFVRPQPPQQVVRPSQAQLRAQVMNSLDVGNRMESQHHQQSVEMERAHTGEPRQTRNGELSGGQTKSMMANGSEQQHHYHHRHPQQQQQQPLALPKDGSLEAAKAMDRPIAMPGRELFPENPPLVNPVGNKADAAAASARPEELANALPERKDSVPESLNGNGVAKNLDKPAATEEADAADDMEEVDFQPVDLDKKYRDKELVRHYTAAKIQNREEALLHTSNPGTPGLPSSRKVPVGEEPAAMTIEFLRARLQAERSASKTNKLKMEQLSKKVADLENKLVTEIELRKTAEASLQDALLKLQNAGPQADIGVQKAGPNPTPVGPGPVLHKAAANGGASNDPEKAVTESPPKEEKKPVSDAVDNESEKTVLRVDKDSEKTVLRADTPTKVVESTKDYNKDLLAAAGSGEDKELLSATNDKPAAAAAAPSEGDGGLWKNRSVSLKAAAAEEQDPVRSSAKVSDANGSETSGKASRQESGSSTSLERVPTPTKLETRAAIEDRLRSMWARIGEDMAALTEVRGDESSSGRKDGAGWIAQLPIALQEKQSSGDQVTTVSNGQQTDEAAAAANGSTAAATSAADKRSSFKRNASLAKNVAKLVEQFEYQETAQREWEESHEASRSVEQSEGEPPALVTPDGDVVPEGQAGTKVSGGISRSQSHGERKLDVEGGPISRSKSLGFLPSQQGLSKKGSSNGRMEMSPDNDIEEGGCDEDEELLFDPETEVAEELPNGIYLHHPRAEVDAPPVTRGVSSGKDKMHQKGAERGVDARSNVNSPRRRERSASAARSRERYSKTGGDKQGGWPVREAHAHDGASRDMFYDYEPVLNNRNGRLDVPPYGASDRDFLPRSKSVNISERVVLQDDKYRGGTPQRGDGRPVMDRAQSLQEERRGPPSLYSHSSGESEGGPPPGRGVPYGYREKGHFEQDVPYRSSAHYRSREDPGGHRGVPPPVWHEGEDPGFRNRAGVSSNIAYGYPPSYRVDEPQHAQYAHPGMYSDVNGGYAAAGQRDMPPPYMGHGPQLSGPEYYAVGGMQGPRVAPMNGYLPTDHRPSSTQIYSSGWENVGVQEEQHPAPPVRVTEEGPLQTGEASEVLKALRIAKQQIKSSNIDQAAVMTAQYTVSQEHRIGAGGQVSKTSYTVEAPVGYPRVTKTVHGGWHLDGGAGGGGKPSLKKRGGFNGSNGVAIDLTGANVTELINGTTPLTVSGAESSYVEKLNVGRGIQFFFG